MSHALPTLPKLLALAAAISMTPFAYAADSSVDQQELHDLQQRLLVLERKLEIQQEEADAKVKETPVVFASKKEGFGIRSADGDYTIKFSGVVQAENRTLLDNNVNGLKSEGIIARYVRPTIEGTAGKLIGFKLTTDFNGANSVGDGATTTPLIDAYVDVKPSPYAFVRIGKQQSQVGLERIQSIENLSFTERGLVSDIAPKRDIGVTLFGNAAKKTINYSLGIMDGAADGQDIASVSNGVKEVQARFILSPFKNDYGLLQGLSFGVGGSYGHKNPTSNTASANPTVGAGTTATSVANQSNAVAAYVTPGQNKFFTYNSNVFASGNEGRISPQATYYHNSFGVLAEYIRSNQQLSANSPGIALAATTRTVSNDAYNVQTSYVLTGEDASYTGVKPANPFVVGSTGWGAFEVVARIGQLRVGNDAFRGFVGTGANQTQAANSTALANPYTSAHQANNFAAGLNWYLTKNFKLATDYNETHFEGGAVSAGRLADRATERALFSTATLQF